MNKIIFAAFALFLGTTGCSASFRTAPICDAYCASQPPVVQPMPAPVVFAPVPPPPAVFTPPPVIVAPPPVIVAPPHRPHRPHSSGQVTIGGSISAQIQVIWNAAENCWGYYDNRGHFVRTR